MSGIQSRPPPHINVNLDPNRDSRFESAQQADDIYALYGRDSWALSDTASLREPHIAAASHSDVGSPRPGPNGQHNDQMEQLDSDEEVFEASPPRPSFETAHSRPDFSQPRPGLDTPDSPRADAFYQGDGMVHAQPYHPGGGWGDGTGAEHEHTDRHVPATPPGPQQYVRPPSENHAQSGPPESVNSHYSSSMAPHEPSSTDHHYSPYSPYGGAGVGPQAHSDQYHDAHSGGEHDHYAPGPQGVPIASSGSQPQPPQTPSQPSTISRIPPPSLPPHLRTPERLSPPQASPPGSAPVHPSIARLNGRVPRTGPPASPSSAGDHSMSLSQASLVSSQYPGEDDEAFHVRSTCKSSCFGVEPQLTSRCSFRGRGRVR